MTKQHGSAGTADVAGRLAVMADGLSVQRVRQIPSAWRTGFFPQKYAPDANGIARRAQPTAPQRVRLHRLPPARSIDLLPNPRRSRNRNRDSDLSRERRP